MKKKILTLIATFLMLVNTAYADIYVYPESVGNITCKKTGKWVETDLIGYNESAVFASEGEAGIEWNIRGAQQGVYRLYIWNSIKEDGCTDAEISYSSEMRTELKVPIDMSRGVSGWKEVGTYEVAGAGTTIKLNGKAQNTLVNSIRLEPLDAKFRSFITLTDQMPDAVILRINSFNAFISGKTAKIKDSAPVIQNNRTLVPVRFVSEAFGAEVIWNDAERCAEITAKDNTLKFTLDSNEYISGGEKKTLDSPAKSINDRLMLPIRVISEELEKEVFWDERGLIIISDKLVNSVLGNSEIINNILSITEGSDE